jgi:peptidoglycan/xylan/chitin deacetylase (PgdA/CDA1 family)
MIESRVLAKKKGGLILLYHRVADVKEDPHSLCVSRKNFDAQIKWLKNNSNVISLSRLVVLLKACKLNKNFVCVTFDDGYEDNYVNAHPILKKYQVPATFFVTTGYVNTKKQFYWDSCIKSNKLNLPISSKHLIELSRSDLIEIGSHTVTHPHLSKLTSNRQGDEVANSRKMLEKSLKAKIRSFSYPFGTFWDINKISVDEVQKAGYKYACVNVPGKVFNFTNPYLLPRLIIRDWNLNHFRKVINKTT